MKKPIVLLDMDDTLADFCRHPAFRGEKFDQSQTAPMFEPGFFLSLKPVEGALVAVRALINMGYDVQVATQPLAESPHCYQEKIQWLGMWFPELVKKVNMVQDKGILRGDYLIDDNAAKWDARWSSNGGKFIHFRYVGPWETEGSNGEMWARIVTFFELEKSLKQEKIDRVTRARREDFES